MDILEQKFVAAITIECEVADAAVWEYVEKLDHYCEVATTGLVPEHIKSDPEYKRLVEIKNNAYKTLSDYGNGKI